MVQLRGEKVKELIRDGLNKLSLAAGVEGKRLTYNASELSALIGVSRPTLYKYSEFIDEVLKDLSADKKNAQGLAVIGFMREKMERLETEKSLLKKEVDVLRKHHAKLYETLYSQSAKLAPLIKPIVAQENKEAGRCILCNHVIDADAKPARSNKVVSFPVRAKKE